MQRSLRRWITAAALTGVGVFAVTPIDATAPLLDVQHGSAQLTATTLFPIVDPTQLWANTADNFAALYGDPFSLPGVIAGLDALSTSAASGVLYNPAGLTVELGMALVIASGSFPAAGAAIAGVSGDVAAAFAAGDTATAINALVNAIPTVLNALLNGTADPDQFGVLTTPSPNLLTMLVFTIIDELFFVGGDKEMTDNLPELTGGLTFNVSLEQLLHDVLHLDLTTPGGTLTVGQLLSDLGVSDSVDILPKSITVGEIFTDLGFDLNKELIPTLRVGNFIHSDPCLGPACLHDLLALAGLQYDSVVLDGFSFNDALDTLFDSPDGTHASDTAISLPQVSVSIYDILKFLGIDDGDGGDVKSSTDVLGLLGFANPQDFSQDFDLTGDPVPSYVYDWARDLMALLGMYNTTVDLVPWLTDALSGLPGVEVSGPDSGDLTVNLTNVLAELLNSFFVGP